MKSCTKPYAPLRVAVIGGGAAGFFGALACAGRRPDAIVHIFEKSPTCLAKVAVSGGGRCNVTHACFDPRALAAMYPRGARELLGAFHRFQPEDTVRWFAERGVPLYTAPDGCMFPVTNQAATIVDCLYQRAAAAGIGVQVRAGVTALRRRPAGGFVLTCASGPDRHFDAVLLATGGRPGGGYALAAALGHTIEPLAPSLFALRVQDAGLTALAGIVVEDVAVAALNIRQTGQLLITHEGVSGPAILKLSAWAARPLHDAGYRAELHVNWLPGMDAGRLRDELRQRRIRHGGGRVVNLPVAPLQKRLWAMLLARAGVPADRVWAALTNAEEAGLLTELADSRFMVSGQSTAQPEFVTCGGVCLKEVDCRTMQSRICPGLYFAGELLDIDGLTGGFNLQAAWTTGWVAGQAMAAQGQSEITAGAGLEARAGIEPA